MFLPNIYEQDNNLSCINVSVKSYASSNSINVIGADGTKKKTKKKKEEIYNYYWDGSFSIRLNNVMVFIHSSDIDPGLFQFERKLLLIKEKIDLYFSKLAEYAKGELKEAFNERTWLNPIDVEPLYTGYININVNTDGNSRFYIADCHRTINLLIEYWRNDKGEIIENPRVEKTKEFLKAIGEQVPAAIALIQGAREQFISNLSEQQ